MFSEGNIWTKIEDSMLFKLRAWNIIEIIRKNFIELQARVDSAENRKLHAFIRNDVNKIKRIVLKQKNGVLVNKIHYVGVLLHENENLIQLFWPYKR